MHEKGLNTSQKSAKKLVKRAAILAMAGGSIFFVLKDKGQKHDPQPFVLRQGGSLIELVRDSITLTDGINKTSYQLQLLLAKQVAEDNNITDPRKMHAGDTIVIDVDKLDDITKNRMKKPQEEKLDDKNNKHKNKAEDEKKKESIVTREVAFAYSTINKLSDLDNLDSYLIKRLKNDDRIKAKIEHYLKKGYSIKVPNEIEDKTYPSWSIQGITEPDKILGSELKGKTFVLDPGHGSMDVGAIGFAEYGTSKQEMVVVYESAVTMDVTYRIAKLIRSHGGSVVFTHYYNKRPILEQKDLPPSSRVIINGNEKFQDIWNGTDYDCPGDVFQAGATRLGKRANICNQTKNVKLFISIHADSYENRPNLKILSVKHQPGDKESKKIAEDLIDNHFEYSFNGKKAEEVKHDAKAQNIKVLRDNKYPAILVELGNMNNTDQAYRLRDQKLRQGLAESFVQSLLQSLELTPIDGQKK